MDVAEKLGGNAMSVSVLKPRPLTKPTPGPCPVITTERLVLRPHRVADADNIAASLGDFQVTRMLSRVPTPYHRQDALDWLSPKISGLMPDWTFAVTEADDVHIGTLSLEIRHGCWHLGYWLNRFYWGRGFVSEAAPAAIERFFRRMPETPLYSGAFADNPASLKIQQKLGFRITGCRDLFCLARNAMVPHLETVLTPEDFRPRS